MSNQVYANSQKLYTQTLQLVAGSGSAGSPAGAIFSPAILYTYNYFIDGSMCTILINPLVGTVATAAFTLQMGILPVPLRPYRQQAGSIVIDNTTTTVVGYYKITPDGTFTVVSPTASVVAASFGLEQQAITYPLN